ncbi:MAG: ParA family protein [Gammaproteobacteria bacterium]|nr:ParA family protein [Gammaproteobacteria bacterium]
MNIWAVANQKGGVGKTTTAVTLAGQLAAEGQRILLVDLDPHGSLTTYFGLDPDTIDVSVYTLFKDRADRRPRTHYRDVLRATAFENLTLLPAATALATLDRQLGAQDGMGLVLVQTLNDLKPHFDHVLIDCPPMLGVLMVNALAACHRLLIPVQCEFLALKGLERMLHTLKMISRARGGEVPRVIVPTMYDRRTRASVDALQVLHERHGDEMWLEVIPVDTQFREASKLGRPLSLWQPRARGALAYLALLDHLLGRAPQPTIGASPFSEQPLDGQAWA